MGTSPSGCRWWKAWCRKRRPDAAPVRQHPRPRQHPRAPASVRVGERLARKPVCEPGRFAITVGQRGADGQHALPTSGRLGEVRAALEAELGPIADQQALTTVGAVVASDLILLALRLIAIGAVGILLWITYRFRDVKMGVTALVALLHDVLVVVGVFAILGTVHRPRDRRPVRDRDAHRHRLLGPRHDRRVRPHPREQGAATPESRSTGSSTTRSSRRSAARSRPA